MKFVVATLLATGLASIVVSAQQTEPDRKRLLSSVDGLGHLQVTIDTKLQFLGGWGGKAKCDDSGSLFVRLMAGDPGGAYHPISTLPIRKVSEGKLGVSFSLPTGVANDLQAMDFFVAPDGKVYAAASSDSLRALYLLTFASDGSLISRVKVNSDFFLPYQIAVFKSGEFMLSGIQGLRDHTPFTGVFSTTGQLINRIYEAEDEDARKRADAGEADYRPDGMLYGNSFVSHGDAVAGPDGNVYLIRASSPALIYVISAKGTVLRTMRVEAPSSELGARLKASPDSLAVVFRRRGTNEGTIKIIDYQGRSIADHSPDDSRTYPGLLGCYDGRTFTFLSHDEAGGVHTVRAELK